MTVKTGIEHKHILRREMLGVNENQGYRQAFNQQVSGSHCKIIKHNVYLLAH
jgi:hypothetical protein